MLAERWAALPENVVIALGLAVGVGLAHLASRRSVRLQTVVVIGTAEQFCREAGHA